MSIMASMTVGIVHAGFQSPTVMMPGFARYRVASEAAAVRAASR